MSGRRIIEGLEEAVAMARAMPPTDAEVEAMAERLWNTYRGAKPGSLWTYVDWRDLSMREAHTTSGKQCIAFRAMARAALEKRDDG